MATNSIGSDMESCIFPRLVATSDASSGHETCTRVIQHVTDAPEGLDNEYRFAFALLLKAYTCRHEVVYGFIDATKRHEARKEATTIRFKLDGAANLLDNARELLEVTAADTESDSTRRDSLDVKDEGVNQYNTLLCITQNELPGSLLQCSSQVPIILEIMKAVDSLNQAVKVKLHFSTDYCDQWSAQNVVATFEHILGLISTRARSTLRQTDLMSTRDAEQAKAWNIDVPAPVYSTLNEKFEKIFREQAEKTAVYTSEGSLTYRQVDDISSLLAARLIDAGVKANTVVPICMNKSRWTTCAMVAVWKAGGALTAMEPANPDERLLSIVNELQAKIMICDSVHASRFDGLGVRTFSDIEDIAMGLSEDNSASDQSNAWHMSNVAPDDLAYVVFTSGSTGKPKGILNTHRRLMTEHQWFRENMGFHEAARVLQFASYAFVAGTADNYRTLLHGATLCVPDEVERTSELVKFINKSRSTRVLVTPSFLRTLDPTDMPTVQDLAVVGEPVSHDFEAPWSEGRRFVQIYGSTEGGTWLKVTSDGTSQSTGLRPTSGAQWLIDPNNPDQLVPIGAMGEIVLESHETMTGYLNDSAKTDRAFIECPAWADKCHIAAGCKYLRLGDLGRYERDGGITIFGRADTQVKINGQRVDLQDIESNLRALLPPGSEVVVDLIKPFDASDRPLLTAFCQSTQMAMEYKHDSVGRHNMLAILQSELSSTLPQYMIPKAFIVMEQLPRNFSQKIDRKKLRTDAEQMGRKALAAHIPSLASQHGAGSMDDKESTLAQAWATVLHLDQKTIKRSDSFLALGGDSLAAIRLVPTLRSKGLRLATVDVLRNPLLRDMAKYATEQAQTDVEDDFGSASVSLGSTSTTLQATDFQEWAALVGARNGGWIDHFIYDFRGDLDVDRLQRCCQQLVDAHSVLRSIFVLHEERVHMKILPGMDITLAVHNTSLGELENNTKDLCNRKRICPLGAPIVRFDIIVASPTRHRLIIRLSHAQYDGFAAGSVGEHLRLLYLSQPLPRTLPYHDYAKKIREPDLVQSAEDFWTKCLRDSQMPKLVNRISCKTTFDNKLDGEIHWPIKLPGLQHIGINPAALVKTAWALVVAALSQGTDIVFGDFVSGRQVQMAGIETVFGACVNFTPVRVRLNADLTNLELLEQVQEFLFQAMPHESLGTRHIIDHSSDWGPHARHSSIVNFINFEPNPESTSWSTDDEQKPLDVTYIYEEEQHDKTDLWLLCRRSRRQSDLASGGSHFDLYFRFSKSVYGEAAIDKIAEMYCSTLRTLTIALDSKISVPRLSAAERMELVPTLDG